MEETVFFNDALNTFLNLLLYGLEIRLHIDRIDKCVMAGVDIRRLS